MKTANWNVDCLLRIVGCYAAGLIALSCGCIVQPPGGAPVEAVMLGSTVDEVNRHQEENAEASKFVVYAHEFEINVPLKQPPGAGAGAGFEYLAPERVRGFRLTPYGQDHVYQIAQQIVRQQQVDGSAWPPWDVVIERSETSKVWDTRHHYPVHFNPELDAARRQTIVRALESFGVVGAEEFVVVAPAFAEGLDAGEAAAAFSQAVQSGSGSLGGSGGGRGF